MCSNDSFVKGNLSESSFHGQSMKCTCITTFLECKEKDKQNVVAKEINECLNIGPAALLLFFFLVVFISLFFFDLKFLYILELHLWSKLLFTFLFYFAEPNK